MFPTASAADWLTETGTSCVNDAATYRLQLLDCHMQIISLFIAMDMIL